MANVDPKVKKALKFAFERTSRLIHATRESVNDLNDISGRPDVINGVFESLEELESLIKSSWIDKEIEKTNESQTDLLF